MSSPVYRWRDGLVDESGRLVITSLHKVIEPLNTALSNGAKKLLIRCKISAPPSMVLKMMCRCSLVIYRCHHSGFQRFPRATCNLPTSSTRLGLRLEDQTDACGRRPSDPLPITIGSDPIEFTTSFVYLGLKLSSIGDLLTDNNKSPELPEVLLLNTNIYNFLVKIKQTMCFFFLCFLLFT